MITLDELRAALAKCNAPGDTEVLMQTDELMTNEDNTEVVADLTFELAAVATETVMVHNPKTGQDVKKVGLKFTLAVRDNEMEDNELDEEDEEEADDEFEEEEDEEDEENSEEDDDS